MFHSIREGRSAADALVHELGVKVMEAAMYLEWEQKCGPDPDPREETVCQWASPRGSIYLGARQVAVEHPRRRGRDDR